eukprot:13907472-Ditylum_brightwellii.AAC.1
MVQKHLDRNIATSKGHLHQTQKNICSTKQEQKQKEQEPYDELIGNQEALEEKTQEYFLVTIDLADAKTGKAFGDRSGPFPMCSLSGNRYIFIYYSYDANAILAEAIHNRTETEIIRAFDILHDYLNKED